ncbi:MAG: alpha/beta hydrolase [Nocardioidaceae bacterium]
MGDPDAVLTLPDGRQAQWWDGGDPRGSAVFFFRGCPDTRHAARSGADAARELGIRLVAVNRPGYGRSTSTESDHVSVADDTVAVADLLGIDRFAALGMSVGGPYALVCAARHPDRVRSLALVSAPGMIVEMDPPWHRDDLTTDEQDFFHTLSKGSVAEAVAVMRPDFESYVDQLDPGDTDDPALVRRWMVGIDPVDAELLVSFSDAELAESVREALEQPEGYLRDAAVTFRTWEFRPETVTCPTSLWYGALDRNHPVRNGRWLADRIHGATLTELDGTAHLGALLTRWEAILGSLL